MKFRREILVTLLLGAAFGLTACAVRSGGGDITGTTWVLSEINGAAPLDGTTLTATFDAGQVSGSAGCNSYGGDVKIRGSRLTFSNVFSTMMACMSPDGVLDQEQKYLDLLNNVASYSVSEGRLELANSFGSVTLVFTAQAPTPDAVLEGTVWSLTTFEDSGAASSLLAGTPITLTFDGAQVSGSGGCNSFGGSYALNGSSLNFSDVFSTDMACLDPEGVMDQEQRFFDALHNVTGYTIQGNHLTLTTGDGRALIFTAQ